MSERHEPATRRDFVVDGETFSLTIRADSFQFTWIKGPNPDYGFGGTLAGAGTEADRAAMLANLMTDQEATSQIRAFLKDIDPATGYLWD
ncbi:hypothetical protein SAMN02800687_0690 [Curtobacterium sp. UNCCL20]|nr:hypothetical protein SAMN02800687_0690 [Curtobacterium sp. UNCCL20]